MSAESTEKVDHIAPTDHAPVPSRAGGLRLFVAWTATALALLHPLARLTAHRLWLADLMTHFQEPALAVSLLAGGLWCRRRPRVAAALGLLALIQLAPIARLYLPGSRGPDPASTARLRLLVANVLVDNPRRAPLIELIRSESPDVVGLVEVSDRWLAELEEVRRDYPYRLEAPDGPRGLALWFRQRPLSLDGPHQLPTPDGWPFLHATFAFAGVERHLWLVHPSSPLRRQGQSESNLEVLALTGEVASVAGSRIVVGDLNTTDGSPYFRDLLATSGLRDSRLGFGRQPSWPDWSPYRIAIDHALVSDDLAVIDRRLGPQIGSDHFPLILELAPAPVDPDRAVRSSVAAARD